MLPLIIGGVLVAAAYWAFADGKKKPASKKAQKDYFQIYVKSEKFGKSYLDFDNKMTDAADFYEKLVKNKKITYKDIVLRDADEKKIYEENKGTKGYPRLADISKIFLLIYEGNGIELRRKSF